MRLRKLNAGIGLVSVALLLGHAILLAVWMLTMGGIPKPAGIGPWILTWITCVHAVLCIVLMIFGHKGTGGQESRQYPQLIGGTILQRLTGILLLLFTALHVLGAAGYMQPPQLVHAIVPPLFFTISMVHVAISVTKAFITLGIGSAKFIKVADIAVKVICGVTLVADIVGFYLFVC